MVRVVCKDNKRTRALWASPLGPRTPELRCGCKAGRRAWKELPPGTRQRRLPSAHRCPKGSGDQRSAEPGQLKRRPLHAAGLGECVRRAEGKQGPAGRWEQRPTPANSLTGLPRPQSHP